MQIFDQNRLMDWTQKLTFCRKLYFYITHVKGTFLWGLRFIPNPINQHIGIFLQKCHQNSLGRFSQKGKK